MKCTTSTLVMLAAVMMALRPALAGETPQATPAVRVTVELADGSRVLGTPVVDQLELHTDYANLKLKLTLVQTIEWDTEHRLVHISLQSGDKLTGRLSMTSLDLKTVFGAVTIPVAKVQRLTAAESCEPATGYALQFDGRQNHVSVSHDRALDPLSAMTLECWFKTRTHSDHAILGKRRWAPDVDHGYQLHVASSGHLHAFWEGSGLMGREVNDGRWHHAALTWDGTRRRLFQDGIKVAEDRPGPWTPTTCQFRIGAIANIDQELFYYGAMRSTQPLAYFDGTIAEVRLSNTDRYCGQNFTPKTGFAVDANTVGYWKLNEGSGTTIRDQTGHGHTGKLVGNPLPRWINDPPHLSPAKQRQFRQGGVLDQE